MKKIIAVLVSAVSFSGPVFAQNSPDHGAHHPAGAGAAQAATVLSEGEVRKVDKETQKVTIKHGPIPNLDMPGMTMVFRVADPAMLNRLNAGDKIRFSADRIGGAYTVTRVEVAK